MGGVEHVALAQPFTHVLPTEVRDSIEETKNPGPREGDRGLSRNRLVDLSGRLSNQDLSVLDPCPSLSGRSAQPDVGRGAYERQKHVRLGPEEVRELLDVYRAGTSVTELATAFGIHRTTVLLHLERHGVDRRPARRRLTDEDVAQAVAFYADGESLATVATRFEVNASTIKREFDRARIRTRPGKGGPARRNTGSTD